jgi:hypothetical protein
MAVFPLALWLMLRWPDGMMVASVALYFLARHFLWNLTSYPAGVWYFDPFAWQLLFMLGGWLALDGAHRLRGLASSKLALILSIGFLIFALMMTLSGAVPPLQSLFPDALRDVFVPNDKTYLAPYRVLHLAALVVLVVHFIPREAPILGWRVFRPLIKCGEQSLEVFCVGVYLAFVAHFVLITVSNGLFAQLIVGACGLLIMIAVAYYRSWSKQVDRLAPRVAVSANQPGD